MADFDDAPFDPPVGMIQVRTPAGGSEESTRGRGGRAALRGRGRQLADRYLLPLAGLMLVGGLWEIVGRFVIRDRLLFAPMSSTFVALYDLLSSGAIAPDLVASAEEFALGFLLAAVIGVGFGALFAASHVARRLFSAVVQAGYATPIIAITPVIIVLVGIGIRSKVIVAASLAVFPILIGTEGALTSINPEYVETARAFGASRFAILRKVIFPAAAVGVVTGLRLGVGRGIIGVVVAEFFGASKGLGFLLVQYSNSFQTAKTLAVVVLLAVIGIVTNGGLLAFERRLSPWNRGG